MMGDDIDRRPDEAHLPGHFRNPNLSAPQRAIGQRERPGRCWGPVPAARLSTLPPSWPRP